MADNIDLRQIAKNAAEGIPMEFPEPAATHNPLMADVPSGSPMVGGTPVIIEPAAIANAPKEESQDQKRPSVVEDPIARLMDTPTPVDVKPTPIGLDADTLATPAMAQTSSGTNGLEDLHYLSDGVMSDGQLALLSETLPDVPVEERGALAASYFNNIDNEYRLLTIQARMSPEDAQRAVRENLSQALRAANAKWKTDHNTVATIIMDKSQDSNDLGLTKEEHEKIERVNKLRLVLLEDVDLKTVEIEHPDEEHKVDYIRSIGGSLSNYSIPLPMLGDFVTLKGAQIMQMINLVQFDDSTVDEIMNVKASLIYEKLLDGAVLKKFNENGSLMMTYQEFINKFPYEDLDIAIFGILCASSLEESSTSTTCQNCSHTWDAHYSTKNLLKMDDIPDFYKKRIDDILANKSNGDALRALYEERRKVRRYKSPFTGNIYDMSYGSVARAISLFKRIKKDDPVAVYNSAIALYLNQILIYNANTGKYIQVTSEDPDMLMETMKTLSNEDLNILATKIREELHYAVEFKMDVECPSCHRKASIPLSIDNLIFLKAQDSMVEIE